MEKPPLIYWSSALTATWLQGLLPIHAGAQCAVLLWLILTLLALAKTAKVLHGDMEKPDHGRKNRPASLLACLLFLGTVGVMEPAASM